MATLSAWQKLTRVLPGRPFGDGVDGAYSSATIPTMTYKSCSGTADSTTLTASTSSPFLVGDILLIHQSRGTGVGQWEINRVSAVGSGQYTMQVALKYTYTDSGASQAQAVKIPRYTDVTVQSGTWTITDWSGDTGGVLAFASNRDVTITGTISGVSKGFLYGTTDTGAGDAAEGSAGDRVEDQYTANGNGGGGGSKGTGGAPQEGSGAGGGGNGASGSSGHAFTGNAGAGGSSSGAADLTTLTFGGGGGGGGADGQSRDGGGVGGDGGGVVFIFAKNISGISGAITLTGGNGTNANSSISFGGGGGGGAGGSCLIACQTATLGSSKITAVGGTHGEGTNQTGGTNDGGDGAVGRIAVHHSSTVTGTSSPTFTDTTDETLIEQNAGFLMNFI